MTEIEDIPDRKNTELLWKMGKAFKKTFQTTMFVDFSKFCSQTFYYESTCKRKDARKRFQNNGARTRFENRSVL